MCVLFSAQQDDAEWEKLGLKPGQKLSMMGTADKVGTAMAASPTAEARCGLAPVGYSATAASATPALL